MDISNNLKEFFYELKLQNITATEIAIKLNISKKTLSNYINGDRYLPLEHLNSLCNMFYVSADYILGLTDKKQYSNYKYIENLDKITIGKNLKNFRKEIKVSQDFLANEIDSNKASISKYENGINLILTFNLYLLAKKYNVSVDYLLGKTDEPKYLS
ncbi:MAG: helix-turn-helix transcriptional regulator [Bacilli bacterium]|nr:helix-turn-helix transcriptional regulator [Bacilli bacterium]